MDFHPDIPSLHLERRAHSLTCPPHINRISKFRLPRINQALRFERLSLFRPGIFQLLVSPGVPKLDIPPYSAFLELIC